MISFPGSPRLLKGALVAADPANPLASVVVFQYNPESLTRRLEARSVGGENGAQGDVLRLTGPPQETISLSVTIDAADQLERVERPTTQLGIYPTLSALEMMLYPKSSTVIQNTILAQAGNIEIVPPAAPLTLFIWGIKRVLPVRVSGMSITEEFYDPDLNPIRGRVELSLTVLSYHDFTPTQVGFGVFMAHQVAKEAMATVNVHNSAPNLMSAITSVF